MRSSIVPNGLSDDGVPWLGEVELTRSHVEGKVFLSNWTLVLHEPSHANVSCPIMLCLSDAAFGPISALEEG